MRVLLRMWWCMRVAECVMVYVYYNTDSKILNNSNEELVS